jgi:hypothetical protein
MGERYGIVVSRSQTSICPDLVPQYINGIEACANDNVDSIGEWMFFSLGPQSELNGSFGLRQHNEIA